MTSRKFSRKRIGQALRGLWTKLARAILLVIFLSTTALGFSLFGNKAPTSMPPFRYWDFRQFADCKIPLTFLTKQLPKGPNGEQMKIEAVQPEIEAAVKVWNDVSPSILKIDLHIDKGATWPDSPGSAHGMIIDHANVLIFAGRGAGSDEPGEAYPHPLNIDIAPKGMLEEMVETDIALEKTAVWTNAADKHKANVPSYERVIDIQTVLIHELGHFLGLGHDESNRDFTMHPKLSPTADRDLHENDKQGLNFLYTPDLGDAPFDLQTKVHTKDKIRKLNDKDVFKPGRGAVHLLGYPPFEFEWLGDKIDGECQPKQVDGDSDDGVDIRPSWARDGELYRLEALMIKVTINLIQDQKILAERYDVDHLRQIPQRLEPNKDKALYLNAWADWDGGRLWNDPAEKIIGTGSPTGTQKLVPERSAGAIKTTIVKIYSVEAPKDAFGRYTVTSSDEIWLRFRLDYAEDVGHNKQTWSSPDLSGPEGMAAFGEVEDFKVPPPIAVSVGFSFTTPVGTGGSCQAKTPALGSIQISEIWATVLNSKTNQPLPQGTPVTFTVNLKPGKEKVEHISDIDSITVSAPGFKPKEVKGPFTAFRISVPGPIPVSIQIINLGTVALEPV